MTLATIVSPIFEVTGSLRKNRIPKFGEYVPANETFEKYVHRFGNYYSNEWSGRRTEVWTPTRQRTKTYNRLTPLVSPTFVSDQKYASSQGYGVTWTPVNLILQQHRFLSQTQTTEKLLKMEAVTYEFHCRQSGMYFWKFNSYETRLTLKLKFGAKKGKLDEMYFY